MKSNAETFIGLRPHALISDPIAFQCEAVVESGLPRIDDPIVLRREAMIKSTLNVSQWSRLLRN
jgi:hypothetical protein